MVTYKDVVIKKRRGEDIKEYQYTAVIMPLAESFHSNIIYKILIIKRMYVKTVIVEK